MKKAVTSAFFPGLSVQDRLVVELVVEPVETLSRYSAAMPAGQVRESHSGHESVGRLASIKIHI
jgi:hypothetical protein